MFAKIKQLNRTTHKLPTTNRDKIGCTVPHLAQSSREKEKRCATKILWVVKLFHPD
jgi:hypothetical protein